VETALTRATRSYAALAAKAGKPGAARAAGSACGANPVAVLIPCHRVVRGDGALGGYRWGMARKAALLARWLLPDRAYDRVLVGLFTALAAASARDTKAS